MNKSFDLGGKIAVVTGARQGLGKTFARSLAVAGATVYLMSRNLAGLEAAANEIAQLTGRPCPFFEIDITDESSVERAAEWVKEQAGRLDILVNNAAVGRGNTPLEHTELKEWTDTIQTNLTGTFLCMKHFCRMMIAQQSGKVINLASIAGMVALQDSCLGAYDCSKAAIESLTRCAAGEWARYNIQVNSIAPGYFMTDINKQFISENKGFYDQSVSRIPMRRWGNPAEIGELAVFLASAAADYMTGANIVIDGGYTAW
ncbi:MAG: SDR family oxidoreductase [Anaerolineae bacterium]|nr:SDR family oxidoreductase [Anaerolineae bacterium]